MAFIACLSQVNFRLARCHPCPRGRYAPGSSTPKCAPCSVGNFVNYTGATTCKHIRRNCALANDVSQAFLATSVRDCPWLPLFDLTRLGSDAETPGSPVCTRCRPGKYAAGPAQSACLDW